MGRPRTVLWMERDEWKAKTEANQSPSSSFCLQKVESNATPKAVDGVERTIKFIVSRATEDRDGDIINQSGWVLGPFLKNPVVPFAHDYRSLPVARAINTQVVNGDLVSEAQFPTRDVYEFGDTVFQMIVGGFLNAVSVGFRPKKHEFNKDRGGIDFLEQELLEYSIVPVPANPDALIQARSAGIDTTPLKQWAEKTLDEWHEEKGIWLPQDVVTDMISKMKSLQISVPGAPTGANESKSVTTTGEAEGVAEEVKDGGQGGGPEISTEKADLAKDAKDGDPEPDSDASVETKDSLDAKTVEELGDLGSGTSDPEAAAKAVEELSPDEAKDGEGEEKDGEDDDSILEFEDDADLKDMDDDFFEIEDELPEQKGTGVQPVEPADDSPVQNLKKILKEVGVVKDGTVQKLNPTVLNNPLPGSYEETSQLLEQQAANFLTSRGEPFRPEMDRAFMIGTFVDHAIFCVIGGDRPFADDPCYSATFARSQELGGMPQWSGEATKVDIQISTNIVQQAAQAFLWKNGLDDRVARETTEKVKEVKAAGDDFFEFDDLDENDLIESMQKSVSGSLSRLGEIVEAQTAKAIRKQQGRVD